MRPGQLAPTDEASVSQAARPQPRRLEARSVWLDDCQVDLLDIAGADGWLWERDRTGLAGAGVAERISLPWGFAAPDAAATVEAALTSIDITDEVGVPGSGPIAVGALPFDGAAPAGLVVPAVVVGRTAEGRCFLTTVGPGHRADARSFLEAVTPPASMDPDGFRLSSPVPHREWMALVAAAVDEIAAGAFEKVVLAREVRVDANRPIEVPTVLRRLRALYPMCTIVSAEVGTEGSAQVGTEGSAQIRTEASAAERAAAPDGASTAHHAPPARRVVGAARFVAASPELLVSRLGDRICSQPLAGTIPRSGDPDADRLSAEGLMGSAKDRAEHEWVVRDVERALAPWCSTLDVPATPSIVSFRNVSHLGTLVTGRLLATLADRPGALALAAALHPTAAVGGSPRQPALAWLAAHEGLERGPYAGPAGWVDANGDGEWVLGIRSAVIAGSTARLFAGVGVVDGSDPASELAETQFKLQALLAAVVRP